MDCRSIADEIPEKFLKLRSKALLAVFRLTGKRRSELSLLEVDSFKTEKDFLNITFTLLKKRKGSVLTHQATKSIPLSDPLVQPILEYLEHLKSLSPPPRYFLPRACRLFGSGKLGISRNSAISGRQVFNIVRQLSSDIWPHLFRETVGSDVVKQDPTLIGVFKVQRRLDLEDMKTGFNYLRRYASDLIQRDIEKAAS